MRRQATRKRSEQPGRLVEGQRVTGWREALNELDDAISGATTVNCSLTK